MALVISDRVKETTVTTGTGTITLGGAVSGFRTFGSVLSNNDTTYYAIVGSNEFEVGIGTFSGSTLTRDTVFSSSNSNAKVDFAAGTKNIFITQPASKAVYKDENDTIDINTDNVTEGSTNLYFTNERVDDRVGSLLVAGDNVTLAYDDAAGTLTISATEDNLSNNDTDDLTEGSTNLYYTDTRFDTRLATKDTDDVSEGTTNLYHTTERVQDVVGGQFITNGTHTGISFSYDDFTDGAIDATVSLSPFSTSDLSEGTNLYYTTARFDSAFSGKSTSDLSEGTNLYYTDTRFDTRLATKTTDNLTEGTNLYYTDERVDDRVSNLIQNGTGISFAYNDSLGTLTPTVSLSAFDTDNLSEGSTNLYYTDTRANSAIDARVTQSFVNALNVTAAGVQANSVALGTDTTGNYIATIAGTANKITVTGSGSESAAVTLTLPDDVQIANDLTVAGDLTVNGATTTLGTTNLEVSDNLFELNSGLTTAPVNDSGMLIQRGTSDNAVFMWDESVDKFALGTTTSDATVTGNIVITTGSLVANLEGNVTGNVTGTVSSLSNHDTGDLAEGSNLYHTNERVQDLVGGQFVTNGTHTGISFAYDDAGDGAIDATVSLSSFSTSDLSEGTNLYYTDARFDTRLASKSTSDLSEGTNLYYTDTRFDTRLATKSTSDLSEGTNLYYTDARVESYLDGGTSTPTFASATVSGDLTATNIAGTLTTAAQTNITSVGTLSSLDVSSNITVGGNDTIFAENNVRFKSAGDAYIDHNTTGQNINFRLSNASSLDVTPLVLSPTTVTVAGNLSVDGGTIKLDGNYPTGTGNVALGNSALFSLTSGGYNIAIGNQALYSNTTGSDLVGIGSSALYNNTTGTRNVALGNNALNAVTTGTNNTGLGDRALRDNTGNYNTAAGSDALLLNTTGQYNTAVGSLALDANTTTSYGTAVGYEALSANTANFNTAVGGQALKANSVGDSLVAVGSQSLVANTTGSGNTAVGRDTLGSNTTGNNNVAIGKSALYANVSGVQNTAVGSLALDANTTANSNTGVGYVALSSNTTGAQNSALGDGALFTNSTASNNTAMGYVALYSNTTGASNAAFGANALDANTTGNSNTALGYFSLSNNTTASNNTAIGSSALAGNTTGTQNVAIGFGACDNSTTLNNLTAVGYEACGAGVQGSDATAVGSQALYNNTGASNNAFGYATLYNNTSAYQNTSMGSISSYNITTGYRNTSYGYAAHYSGTTGANNTNVGWYAGYGLTTGNNNICIGYGAGYNGGTNGISTGSDGIYIGANAHGNNDNSKEIVLGQSTRGIGGDRLTFGEGVGGNRVYNSYTVDASWTRVSDERYKTEIQDNNDCGLNFINDLRPVTFKWKALSDIDADLPDHNPEKTEPEHKEKLYGLIAQEVKEALEKNNITDFGGWNVEESSGIQAISQEMFIHPLIKAVQELSSQVESLKQEINDIKGGN